MTQGKLLLIGGAEGKQGEREILSTFVRLAGGAQAHIYVIPSASEYPVETGQLYTQIFLSLGAARVSCLPFHEREQTEHTGYTLLLEGATGYFFTGGQQARLLDVWQDSPAWEFIAKSWRQDGAIIAGTSAGAAVMSERVILFSDRDQEKSSERIVVAEGMNLLSRAIIDQHFSQRSRLDRLLAVVLAYPELLGVGIDEDTAILVDVTKDCFAVMGNHSVTVVDGYRQYRMLKGDQFHIALRTVIPFRS